MKKTIALLVSLCALVAGSLGAAWVYNAYLVNQIVTANQNFTLNLNTTPNASGITHISAQAIYSTASVTTNTFTDGRLSTGTITVSTISGLLPASATDQITIAANAVIQSAQATNSLVVNSTGGLTGAYLTINGSIVSNNGWRIDVTSDTAADIATEIGQQIYQVLATSVGTSTVTLTARSAGTPGNSYTLVSSTPAAITAGAATFSGGKDPAFRNQSIVVNGQTYLRGYYWNNPNTIPETSTGTAISIAALLNTITGIKASAVGSVVYATATVAGAAGNAFTIVSSTPSAMTVASANFTGGLNPGQVCINGTCLKEGSQWTLGASSTTTTTAASIAAAINASSALNTLVAAANVAGVVTTTSTAVGIASNYSLSALPSASLVVSHPSYVGGLNSAYTINTGAINIPGHGLATGYGVVFSTPAGAGITPLVNGTTYFAIALDPNNIELATNLSNATAGTFITLTSSSTSGPHTFTLTPQAFTGTASMAWYGSVDCVNWNPVSVSSLTITSPSSTPAATLWDFGRINYTCLQLDVIAPTQGGLNLAVKVNGKN